MKNRSGIWPYVFGGCSLLLALAYTPILLPSSDFLGVGGYIVAVAMALGAWIFALVKTIEPFLSAQGRTRFRGRPEVAIGGKHWGLPAVNLLLWSAVIATPPITWAYIYWSGDKLTAWTLCALAAFFAIGLMNELRRRVSARDALLSRQSLTVGELWFPANEGSARIVDSLQSVEKVLAVPLCKLRPTDRFGVEIGSLSFFDETLDILTAQLLQSREAPAWFDANAVKTLKDYVEVWNRLRGRRLSCDK